MSASKFYLLVLAGISACLLLLSRSANTNRVAAAGMPGLGISLTVDYAVLSFRKDDGSFENVGRVEGSGEYVEMMQRLSTPKAEHASPPYDSMEDLWSDWPRQIARRTRKSIGLAASADVGVLSRMLDQLLNLPTPLPGVLLRQTPMAISFPALHGLYQQDIDDAAAHRGVHLLSGPQLLYQPRNMVAAYAGHGLGLCETYQDEETCRQEGLNMPVRDVLLVEYTDHALLLHAGIMREAHDLAQHDITIAADFSLGSSRSHEAGIATRIGQAVRQILQARYGNRGSPEKIVAIVTGDGVREHVVEAVRESIRSFGSEPEVLDSEREYVAARGAAEMAWRSLERDGQAEL